MLKWAIIFAIISLVAGWLGFGGNYCQGAVCHLHHHLYRYRAGPGRHRPPVLTGSISDTSNGAFGRRLFWGRRRFARPNSVSATARLAI